MEPILSFFSVVEEIVRQYEARAVLLALVCAVAALLLSVAAMIRSGRHSNTRRAFKDLHVRTRSLENVEERRLLAGIKGETADESGMRRSRAD